MVVTSTLTAVVLGVETYETYVREVIPQVNEFRSSWRNSCYNRMVTCNSNCCWNYSECQVNSYFINN